MNAIPSEVVELIIDQLADHRGPGVGVQFDRRPLHRCSLVAKAWTARARFHGFASAEISMGKVRGKHCGTRFLGLLASPHATFIASLVYVKLYHLHDEVGTPDMPLQILRQMEARGVRLQRLHIWSKHLFEIDNTPLLSNPIASSIIDLEIFLETCMMRLSSLLDFTQSFPRLERLAIISNAAHQSLDTDLGERRFPALRSLTSEPLQVLKIFLASDVMPQLTTLGLVEMGYDWSMWSILNNALCGVPPENLNIVTLDLKDIFLQSFRTPDLKVFRHLRNVHLTLTELSLLPGQLIRLLGLLPSNLLEALVITPLMRGPCPYTETTARRWRNVDALLSDASAWPALKRIRISLGGIVAERHYFRDAPTWGSSAVVFERDLRRDLDGCVGRGLLEVDF
ncbi:hypothetical protein MKEN_01162500 [Mycena kentingensis (nom. inval.)]|nr:hypothetical protein MKEN_01162500 [Mycena kentingensis (nom. inval.)]